MNLKTLVFSMALIALLAVGMVALPVKAPPLYGPRTSNMVVRVYGTPNAGYNALNTGTIDILQWPVDAVWMGTWTGNSAIQMKSYSELAHVEIDLNSQRWPTGVESPRVYDPETGTFKHFYGTNQPWDDKARDFRKAIAYLCNKPSYVAGYGHKLDTDVPYPAAAGWIPPIGYVSSYNGPYSPISFNPMTAANVLDNAGFTQGTTPNPFYDPAQPWSAQYMRTDPRYGGDLQPLYFYIRSDDPTWRMPAGNDLTSTLRKSGIPVNAILAVRPVCYSQVMLLYDYHLYTGRWALTADTSDDLYFMKHSAEYWGGTSTGYYGGLGWSSNYLGFAHNFTQAGVGIQQNYFDYWTYMGKYPTSLSGAISAAREAQVLEPQLVPNVPLWSMAAVKAYRTGWSGVINMKGYGIDNRWSFLNMSHGTQTTIDWGICDNLVGLNPITSGTHPSLGAPQTDFWHDWKIFDLVYDPLIGRNPFDLPDQFGWLAKSWTVGLWAPGKTYVRFELRSAADSPTAVNPVFHNGDPVRPLDVAFSLIFPRDCGPGVAWNYADVKDIFQVRIPDPVPAWLVGTGIVQDIGLPAGTVEVRFNAQSYWALNWAGMQYVLNEQIWKAANVNLGWGYNTATWNRWAVRSYDPWVTDSDGDGTKDLKEDGTGAWIFQSYAPPGPVPAATSFSLSANTGFYLDQAYISNYLNWAFHLCGDVNDDGKIDIADGFLIIKAMGTDPSYVGSNPPGVCAPPWEWNEYNPNADINVGSWNMAAGAGTYGDGNINAFDLTKWGKNFGLDIDC